MTHTPAGLAALRLTAAALCTLLGSCIILVPIDADVPAVPAQHATLSPAAPTPVGPYSQAVSLGSTMYLSGQIGLDPATGALVEGGVAAQTRRALSNLRAVLLAEGLDMSHVLEVQVFLADIADYAAMNEVYAEFFAAPEPARTTVAVAALPRGAAVEIRAVAGRRP